QRYGMMIVAQIGLSLALLSGAALVVRSALRIARWDFGYDPKPLVQGVAIVGHKGDVVNLADVAAEMVTRARAIPDVADAASSRSGWVVKGAVTVDDASEQTREVPAPMWGYQIVSPSYFRTLGKPII